MINAVRCDKESFKSVLFKPGMNIILADRTQASSKKDSRNGLGKTTLIEIIHFCLGASFTERSPLSHPNLFNWTFYLDIELREKNYTLSRNTASPKIINIDSGDISDWPIKPRRDSNTGKLGLSIKDMNAVLGWLMFDLDVSLKEDTYTPSFRSLVSYFIRKGPDAFTLPFEHFRKQMEWDKQIHNLFLLGLDWDFARRWQDLRDRENSLKSIKSAAKTGLVNNLIGSIGELEAAKVRLTSQVESTKSQLSDFKVHKQYKEIEEKANSLTHSIHLLSNENVSDRRLIKYYEESFNQEKPADEIDVVRLYKEAGINLPDKVVRQLSDVLEFHRRIISNRETYLRSEIEILQRNITEREENIRQESDERSELMKILESHGALEEYTRLQQILSTQMAELDNVNSRMENLKKIEQGKSAINIDKQQLQIEARTDLDERRVARDMAISFYNANSEALYNAAGNLIINVTPSGFNFQVEIERSGSQGIEKMKVFCYDLMLAQLWAGKGIQPGFLIHDSTIFDGVDERQVAFSLQLAAEESKQQKFQYICCLNSDTVPRNDFDKDFDFNSYVRLTLNDASPDGGLLGIRF